MKIYLEYFKHILLEIDYILSDSKVIEFGEFIDNERIKRAFVRSIEIIGEAVKKIPQEIKDKYPEVEWKEIAGTRDRLIHGYMDIDYEIIWDIVKNEIPNLKTNIENIHQKESENI